MATTVLRFLATLSVVLTCGAPVFAQDAPSQGKAQRLPVPPELLEETMDDYFGVYIDSAKIGWARLTVEKGSVEDTPTLNLKMQLSMQFESFGKKIGFSFGYG